jgi:hypothetical protein
VSRANDNWDVCVRIANPTARRIVVPKGVVLAQCEPVYPVKQFTAMTVGTDGEDLPEQRKKRTRPFEASELDFGAELTDGQRQRIKELLDKHEVILSKHESDVGRTGLLKHHIETGDAAPINLPPYRLSFSERQKVRDMVNEYLDEGLIEESDSPWSCPILMVGKKDGTARFCCDWRRLNAVTRRDAMPLPRIDDMIDRLAKAKFFSKIDFTSGFYQVELDDESKEKTAFSTPDGHYQWNVMGMGLTNAPATFQRLMYRVLGGLLWTNSMAYLDDIVVFSPDFDSHLNDLEAVFKRIRDAGMKIKPPKCSFGKLGIDYLGFIITRDGVACDPSNTVKVLRFRRPQDLKDVRAFLGLTSYYRKFIRGYAAIAKPLYNLLRLDAEWKWDDPEQTAFDQLKKALTCPPVLAFPDFEKPFILATDASLHGVGAILKQKDRNNQERVVGFASKVLSGAERNYSATERECYALRWAVGHYRPYLYGTKFTVVTDHRSLVYLRTMKTANSRLNRYLMYLQEFDFDVHYKQGKKHTDADGMSRFGMDSDSEIAGDYLFRKGDNQYDEDPDIIKRPTHRGEYKDDFGKADKRTNEVVAEDQDLREWISPKEDAGVPAAAIAQVKKSVAKGKKRKTAPSGALPDEEVIPKRIKVQRKKGAGKVALVASRKAGRSVACSFCTTEGHSDWRCPRFLKLVRRYGYRFARIAGNQAKRRIRRQEWLRGAMNRPPKKKLDVPTLVSQMLKEARRRSDTDSTAAQDGSIREPDEELEQDAAPEDGTDTAKEANGESAAGTDENLKDKESSQVEVAILNVSGRVEVDGH